jgi:hypothetical protein
MIQPTFFTIAICLTTILANWMGYSSAADRPFTHPGVLHSQAELDFVKARVAAGEEPWKSALE